MLFLTLVRIVIWLTFFLLIVGYGVIIFWSRRAWKRYVVAHRLLEVRVEAIERRMGNNHE